MHIELTDHLRCPEGHPEAFLVLLPGRMDGRDVIEGDLGCPVCGWGVHWDGGVPDFGGGERSSGRPGIDAAAMVALSGLDGPGGWLALVGSAAAEAIDVAALLPGVSVVAVNPPEMNSAEGIESVLSGRWPLKRACLRAVVIGADAADMAADAVGSVLPGLRAVGEGEPPEGVPRDTILAASPGCWVVVARG